MATLELRSISKSFGAVDVLKDIDLDVADGDFVVFVGPSGCGKSTLLRIIAGLEDQSAGEVFIDGDDVSLLPPAKRGIAMVFQSYALYPHMTVERNIGFGLRQTGTPRSRIDEKVAEAARILQLEPLLKRKPRELSGGQRQRVAIGRAIVRNPKVFLFDEPLSNLDAALRVQMRVEIARLHHEIGATMVYVTHDQVEAMTLARRIVVLNDGIVEQVGSPLDLYNTPRNRFVAGFIGSPKMNFVACSVTGVTGDGVAVALNGRAGNEGAATIRVPARGDGIEPGQPLTLGVRPEHLTVGTGNGGTDAHGDGAYVAGRAVVVERLGSVTDLHLAGVGDDLVVVQAQGQLDAKIDDTVTLTVPPDRCHLFREDGSALGRAE